MQLININQLLYKYIEIKSSSLISAKNPIPISVLSLQNTLSLSF